jgi:transporter family-2 protein
VQWQLFRKLSNNLLERTNRMTVKLFSILAALLAGSMIAFQSPINAKLGSLTGGPLVATFFSFAVGTFALGILLIVTGNIPKMQSVGQTELWMWVGGLLGAVFVFVSISVVPILGAALMISLFVAGQLVGALLIDKTGFLLPQSIDIGWERIAALLLMVVAVWLFTRGNM